MQPSTLKSRALWVLLFRDMLREIDFPSTNDLVHLCRGFPLAGAFPLTGIFHPAVRDAELAIEDLWKCSSSAQRTAFESCRRSGDAELDEDLNAATMKGGP